MLYRFGAGTPIGQLPDASLIALYALCALIMVTFTVTSLREVGESPLRELWVLSFGEAKVKCLACRGETRPDGGTKRSSFKSQARNSRTYRAKTKTKTVRLVSSNISGHQRCQPTPVLLLCR
jgi:hypothetical protein